MMDNLEECLTNSTICELTAFYTLHAVLMHIMAV